jgi:BON domain-containing protein
MARRVSPWLGSLALASFAIACAQSDAGITTKVKSQLEADRSVPNAAAIQVETNRHVVTLTGKAASDAEKQRAVAVAKSTEGVKDVVDNLAVDPSVAIAPPAGDGTSPAAASTDPGTAPGSGGQAGASANSAPPAAPTTSPSR